VGDLGGDRLERILAAAPLGAAEMRQQDHLAALVRNLEDGRSHALDTGCVGDLAVAQRHVEVDAQEDALACHIGLIERTKSSHSTESERIPIEWIGIRSASFAWRMFLPENRRPLFRNMR